MKVRLLKKAKKKIKIYRRGSKYYCYHVDADFTDIQQTLDGALRYYRIWVVRNARDIVGSKYGHKRTVR